MPKTVFGKNSPRSGRISGYYCWKFSANYLQTTEKLTEFMHDVTAKLIQF